MTRRAILSVLLVSAASGACSEREPAAGAAAEEVGTRVSVDGGAYTDVTVPELQTMLSGKDFPLINVHVPFEGDLPDTDRSIPFDRITEHLDLLPADKDSRIVLYCRSGSMSTEAAAALAGLGYTNVFNLKGGFRAWREAGLPMVGG